MSDARIFGRPFLDLADQCFGPRADLVRPRLIMTNKVRELKDMGENIYEVEMKQTA